MKTILITGASSGIGRALAVQAARAGYAVFAVGRNIRALAALAGQVIEEGGTIHTDVTDISDPINAPGLIGRAVGAFGHVDVLVNNAGFAGVGPLAMQSDEQLRAQFGTHVLGPLALVREALPTLRASRGHVFMLGSGVARVPVGGMGSYPPSKAALRSATSILRRELVPLDIAVTYVDPGAVDTGFMTRAGMPGAPRDVLVSPEHVARKMLLAIGTRQRVLNVTPLQSAAVALAEAFPGIAEAVLERNPSLVGAGPTIAAIEMQRDNNGRGEKIALPSARPLSLLPDVDAATGTAPETEREPGIVAKPIVAEAPTPAIDAPVPPPVEKMPAPVIATVIDVTPVIVPPPADADEERPLPPTRWQYEPPESEDDVAVTEPIVAVQSAVAEPSAAEAPAPAAADPAETAAIPVVGAPVEEPEEELHYGALEPAADHNLEPAVTTSSFDAALESLSRRMERAKLTTDFVKSLMIVDNIIDVGDAAMRWAGMPNKHERSLTSEVFFALAEWGFLAPRADGRYRVLYDADADPTQGR